MKKRIDVVGISTLVLVSVIIILLLTISNLKEKDNTISIEDFYSGVDLLRKQIDYNSLNIAGYRVQVNECSKFVKTKERALETLKRLKEHIDPYPENLKYMGWDVVYYDE